MEYILLIIGTYLMMAVNRRLLGIPGFFYYSSVRPFLRLRYGEKLLRVEEVYYWEMADQLGNMAQLAILPGYLIAFDLIVPGTLWGKFGVFLLVNYIWWGICAGYQVEKYIPQTPALRPRPAKVRES
ncbi:hypothetical protein [Staphylospora marina]|uniref:hypothetical protein n=1 Tax=Staphylospora marina TaxID=2490858 RepID=UPI000F5BFAD8|nr:hypothetical protein [Staphylospora marina]